MLRDLKHKYLIDPSVSQLHVTLKVTSVKPKNTNVKFILLYTHRHKTKFLFQVYMMDSIKAYKHISFVLVFIVT